ncbi:hypothetical protein HWV62_18192 [Athelia sp. TMB]|nr:hypothetical protein HWV62_18192 [Athelia sp. TMB]
MSLLARAPLMRQSQQALMRSRPVGPVVPRGAHAYHHLPFAWPTNKAVWGAKLSVFLLTGFATPFIAAWYQLWVLTLD